MATRERTKTNRAAAKAGTRRGAPKPPARRPSVAREWDEVERTLDMFERLLSIAEHESRLDTSSGAAAALKELAWDHVRDATPIRVSHAENILGVSNQTVRSWIDLGILDGLQGSPRRVGLESVVRAKRIADELREQGRDRDLMSAVLSRLEALGLEQDKEFRKSVGQMRRRERRPRPY